MLPHSTELHTHELHTTFLMIDSNRISYSYFIYSQVTKRELDRCIVETGTWKKEAGAAEDRAHSAELYAEGLHLEAGKYVEPIILYPLYTLYCRTCIYVHPLYMYIQPYVHLTCL